MSPDPRDIPGFTLVELLIALAISTIVMMAVPFMISLSARAAPTAGSVQTTSIEAADCLAQLGADLKLSRTITELSANAITMTVPARDGSDAAQTIRYAWSGTPGDPVTVSIDGVESTLVASADDFTLTAVTGTDTVYTEQTFKEDTGVTFQSQSLLLSGQKIPNPGSLIQVVGAPTDPDLLGWNATSMSFSLACSSPISGASVVVSIIPLNADKSPAGNPYYSVTIASTDLRSSYRKAVCTIPPLWFSPDHGVGIEFRVTSPSLNVYVGAGTLAVLYSGGNLYASSSDSGPWTTVGGWLLTHDIAGDVLTSTGGASDRKCLERLDVSLTTGDAGRVYATSLTPLNPAVVP